MRSLSELWPRHTPGDRDQRTAFVLSGGAAMGALQVGMIRALIERRILPDIVLGCSVGAINGVVLAGGPSLATVGRIQDVWMDLIDRELVPSGLLPSSVQLVRKGESIASNDGLRELLEEIVSAKDFDELEVHFECVATDIDAATEHWFSAGDLVPAILASASIPAVFPAMEIDGVRYLDGAIVDDVPVRRAVELGATRIFVLQVGALERPRPDLRRPIDVALLAYWIARRHRLVEDLARIPDDVEVVILPHGNPEPVRYNDLSSSAHLMDVAYRASSDHLDARIEGTISPTYGPFFDRDRGGVDTDPGPEEQARVDRARRLFSAVRETLGLNHSGRSVQTGGPDDPDESDPAAPQVPDADPEGPPEDSERPVGRAESLGPAMRALLDRLLERGGTAGTRDTGGDTEADTEGDTSGGGSTADAGGNVATGLDDPTDHDPSVADADQPVADDVPVQDRSAGVSRQKNRRS